MENEALNEENSIKQSNVSSKILLDISTYFNCKEKIIYSVAYFFK